MEITKRKITLNRIDDHMNFEAVGANGKKVLFDAGPKVGGKDNGVGPMDSLLMAAAACSSIDVVLILKKMKQQIDDYKVEVEAERVPDGEASKYKTIHLHFMLTGEIKEKKLEKAIQMSLDKYCSVSKILACSAEITSSFTLNGDTA